MRGLRTFCIAARRLSFRLAAEELFLTASAVSHQIRNLERELGVALFERNPRSLALTEAGEVLFSDMDPLIRQLDEVAGRFHTRCRQRVASIRSCSPAIATSA